MTNGWSYRLAPGLVLRTQALERTGRRERVLLVQSGAAFPPGHPTTRLCLDLLQEVLTAEPIGHFLDVGCGAGVLSLAAAALGVPRGAAVDIIREAARATRDNARRNGLAGAITAIQGSTECLAGRFEAVAANLPWEVQMDKMAELDRLAEKFLILSGFRDNQEGPLLEGYLRLGWSRQRRVIKEFHHPELPPEISFNWVAWQLKR